MLMQLTDALGAEVSLDVLHLRVDYLAVVAGGVQHVPVAAVHPHVGNGAPPASLLEEDQVATLEVGFGYPLAVVPILSGRTVGQPLAKPYLGLALAHAARGGVNVPAGTRAGRAACGRRGGDAPDERYSVGDDPARAAPGRDAHDVSVAGIQLVGADLDPGTPVFGLVD